MTDDDTLVNVRRLLRVLDSHDDSSPIYLGERYGWSHTQVGVPFGWRSVAVRGPRGHELHHHRRWHGVVGTCLEALGLLHLVQLPCT